MKNKCNLTPVVESGAQSTPDIPTEELDSVKKARQQVADLVALAERTGSEQFSQMVQQFAYSSELARTVRVNPRAARNRGVVMQRLMQWLYDPANPESVRTWFVDAKRRAGSLIDALPLMSGDLGVDMARLNLNRQVADIRNAAYDIMRRGGVRSRDVMQEVFVRLTESGNFRYTDEFAPGSNARRLRELERADTLDWIRRQGLDNKAIEQLVQLTDGYIAAHNITLQVARAAGLDISPIEGIGFFHRSFTPEARMIIRDAKIDWLDEVQQSLDGVTPGTTVRSRNTYDFTVEDEIAFAEAFTDYTNKNRTTASLRRRYENYTAKVDAYRVQLNTPDPNRRVAYEAQQNLVERYRASYEAGVPGYNQRGLEGAQRKLSTLEQQLELPKPGYNQETFARMQEKLERIQFDYLTQQQEALRLTAEVLDDEGRVLRRLADMSQDKLDSLVDNGVLSKVPMTSSRVFELLVERYDLPFQGMAEMMVTDPAQAYQHYVDNLRNGMRNSVVTQNLIRGATENSWGVHRNQFMANPETYGNYVSLRDAISTSRLDLDSLGIDPMQWQDMYVHPDVARSYVAMLDFSTNPASTNSFVRSVMSVYRGIGRISKRAMLTQTGFILKNLYGVMVNGWQSGANMLLYPRDFLKIHEVVRQGNNLDLLDNSRRLYSGMTEQELYLQLVRRGVLDNRNMLGESLNIGEDIRQAFSVQNHVNRMRYLGHQLRQGNIGGTLERVGRNIDELSADLLAPLLFETTIIEDTMKFVLAKTLLADTGVEAATRIPVQIFSGAGFQHFNNIDDAVHHIQQHFVDYSDVTEIDRYMRDGVMPFWMYTTRNIPLQIRYMMRHPGRFMGYYRLYHAMNGEAERRGEDFPVDGANQWQLDGMPIYYEGADEYSWITSAAELYDPILEATSFLTKEFTANTPQEQVERALGESGTGQAVVDYLFNQFYPQIKTAYALVSGEDPFTGQELREADSVLGVELPSIGGLRPGLVRYVIENNIPYVRAVNRSNPFGLFGVRQRTNAYGEIIRQSRRSIFGANRYDSDPLIAGDEREVPILLRAGRILNMPVYEVDVIRNMQYSNSFYEMKRREFSALANDAEQKAEASLTPEEQERHIQEWILYTAMSDEMQFWSAATESWLQRRGAMSAEERNELTRQLEARQGERSRRTLGGID